MKREFEFRKLRESLHEAFEGKCSYCGAQLGLTDLGSVAHFYPRSRYPEKASDPENLLLACNICSISKSHKFPLDDEGNPLLLNPRVDNFSKHIKFEKNGEAVPLTKRGESTIQVLRLNRPQLVEQRKLDLLKDAYFKEYESFQPNAFRVFSESMATINRLNSVVTGAVFMDAQYLRNLLYANVITALETYLSDAFISKVSQKKELLRSFVESFHGFRKEKFELSEVFNRYEEIEERSIRAMRDILYHDLPKVSGIYRDTLGIEFSDFGDLYKSVFVRHDLVHRNGKSKSGEPSEISASDVDQLCAKAELFVKDIEAKLALI